MIDRWGPLDDGHATSDAQLDDNSARTRQGSEQVRVVSDDLPARAEAHEPERSARRHDHEACLHDRLAAETQGWLYFAFLHAAEAHRAAARRERGALASVAQRDPIPRRDFPEQT